MKKENRKILIGFVILIVLGFTANVFPQAAVSTAELRGKVMDTTGAVIPGVSITITDEEKGTSRTVVTDDRGEYIAPLLPPSVYDVKAELSGFATQVKKGVTLTVGQTAVLDFKMEVSQIATEVVVTSEAPVVETERTQQSDTIDKRRIDNLPINGRNYLDFALLTPAVTTSKLIADQTDFRVAQTPNTGLSFGGNNGRGNSLTIDGAENNSVSGGVRSTLSQEAIQEFQINRSNFTAEIGSASGGNINIISKSGGNDLHGKLFGFLRNRKLDARNFFDPDPKKSAFTRAQYGATLGGPIKRDQTFFFGSFERLDRHESTFVTFPSNPSDPTFQPTASQTALLDFLSGVPTFAPLAAGVRSNLTTANFPSTVDLFRRSSGVFPFSSNTTTFSLKIDHRFSEKNNLTARYNITDLQDENAQFGALIAPSRGRTLAELDNNFTLSDTYLFSPRALNELRLQFAHFRFNVLPTALGPELNISGFGFFGRNIFLPSKTIDRRYQFVDNFSYMVGNHSFKMGADINPNRVSTINDTFIGGRFNFGEAFPLAQIINSASPGAAEMLIRALMTPTSAGGLGRPDLVPNVLAPINALQAFNLGLPLLYQQGFGDPVYIRWQKRFGFYFQDTWKAASNLTLNLGLRYDLDLEPNPLNRDTNNFGPRVGFSWDPFKDGKTSIRGGYGIYYSPIYFQIPNVVYQLAGRGNPGEINIILTTATSPGATSAVNIFRTLRAQGVIGRRPITAADIAQFGIIPRPGLPLEVRFREDPNFVNPYSHQASFGIEREIVRNWSVSANYLFNRTLKISRARDVNILPGTPGNVDPITGVQRVNFRDPRLLQDNIYESSGVSFYHAMTLSVNKRYSRYVTLAAHYTLSKAIDDVVDFNSDFQANDQTNLRAERSLSSFDQRHRFVFSGLFETPFRPGSGNVILSRIFADFTLAPIVTVGSARPFNLLLGFDANMDRHPNTDRPPGAGRNTGIGPNFASFDLRVTKRLRFDEDGKRSLEMIFEGFNFFNRVNFASVNNIVGTSLLRPPYNVTGRKDRKPTDPLGFASALDPRQLQVGLRLNF